MLTGENGILTKADTAATETERKTIIEEARIKILEKQTDNFGTLTERELTEILTQNYGTLSGEGSVLEKTLTTKDGKYNIPVKEIYTGLLTAEKGKYTIEGEEVNFTIGDKWSDCGELSDIWYRLSLGHIASSEGAIRFDQSSQSYFMYLEYDSEKAVTWDDEIVDGARYVIL